MMKFPVWLNPPVDKEVSWLVSFFEYNHTPPKKHTLQVLLEELPSGTDIKNILMLLQVKMGSLYDADFRVKRESGPLYKDYTYTQENFWDGHNKYKFKVEVTKKDVNEFKRFGKRL